MPEHWEIPHTLMCDEHMTNLTHVQHNSAFLARYVNRCNAEGHKNGSDRVPTLPPDKPLGTAQPHISTEAHSKEATLGTMEGKQD